MIKMQNKITKNITKIKTEYTNIYIKTIIILLFNLLLVVSKYRQIL